MKNITSTDNIWRVTVRDITPGWGLERTFTVKSERSPTKSQVVSVIQDISKAFIVDLCSDDMVEAYVKNKLRVIRKVKLFK